MRLLAILWLSTALSSAPVYALNEKILQAPPAAWVPSPELSSVPNDADGLAFVRSQSVLAHLDRHGQSQHLSYRIKILHPNALQLGNLALAWNPANGPLTIHAVNIHRDGRVVDVLKKQSFQILRREQMLEAAQLDGTLTATLHISDLRVGDELEFSSTTRIKDPTMGNYDNGLLLFTNTPLKGNFQIGLSWADGYKPNVQLTPDLESIADKRDNSIMVRLENPAPQYPPKDAPLSYAWGRIIEFSDFPTWNSISQYFAPIYANAAKLSKSSPIKAEAQRIAANHATDLDRANAALKLVQQDVRYIYEGLSGGNLTPASAEETWKRRFGDCKGKSALLLALLTEMGIQAEAVLVNNSNADDGLDQRLPNPLLFNHVLIRAQIDGSNYWLDGTLPPNNLANQSPAVPYRWFLPLSTDGSTLINIPWSPPETPLNIQLWELDARHGFEGISTLRETKIVRGIESLTQQAQLSGLSSDQLLDLLRQEIIGEFWQSVDRAKWHFNPAANASILTYEGKVNFKWDSGARGSLSTALTGGGSSPPSRRERPEAHFQSIPYYTAPVFSCYVTTIRLPRHTKAADWSHNDPYDQHIFGINYYRAFDIRDGAFRMVKGYRVDTPEIDAATAKKDNDRIEDFDNSKAFAFYDPGTSSAEEVPDPSSYVPTTYEIDWTRDNVPCLSSMKAGR